MHVLISHLMKNLEGVDYYGQSSGLLIYQTNLSLTYPDFINCLSRDFVYISLKHHTWSVPSLWQVIYRVFCVLKQLWLDPNS